MTIDHAYNLRLQPSCNNSFTIFYRLLHSEERHVFEPTISQVQIYNGIQHAFHRICKRRLARADKEKKLDYQCTRASTHYHPCPMLDGTCSTSIDDIRDHETTFERRTTRRMKVFCRCGNRLNPDYYPNCAQLFGVSCSAIPVLRKDHRQK